MKMSLADDVAELEDDFERVKAENRSLEESLDEVEGELEDMINQRNKMQEFYDWVRLAYPVIVKDYESVKIIEEVANGIQK
jgi:predicted nuclease with TOPRIM domain